MIIKHFFFFTNPSYMKTTHSPSKTSLFPDWRPHDEVKWSKQAPSPGDFYPWASDYYRENQFTAMMTDIKRKPHKTNYLFKSGWLKWKLNCLTIYGSSEFSNICRLICFKRIFCCFFLYIYNCFRFFFNCNTTYFFHCSYKKTIKM